MRIPILLLLLPYLLFAEVPKEFYAKANGQYYTFTDDFYNTYVCEVEEVLLLSVKKKLSEISHYMPFIATEFESSFVQKGSRDIALQFMTKGSLASLDSQKLKSKVLKKEREVLREIEGFNTTVAWFLNAPFIFDVDSSQVDSLEVNDTGYVYLPAYNKGYEIHLDKEYRITQWSNTSQTKKGPIFTKISTSFKPFKGKSLLREYKVDVAHGKLTSHVTIEYDFNREYPLFKTISIKTTLRGKSYPLTLQFSNYKIL